MNQLGRLLRIEALLNELLKEIRQREDKVLTVEALSMLTGLPSATIYDKTCSRHGRPPEIPHYKKGKRIYFKESEIHNWLTENKVRSIDDYKDIVRDHTQDGY